MKKKFTVLFVFGVVLLGIFTFTFFVINLGRNSLKILKSRQKVSESIEMEPIEVKPPGAKHSDTKTSQILKQAHRLEKEGKLLKARKLYQSLIDQNPQMESVQAVQQKIWDLNIKLLFSKIHTPDSTFYEVKLGDTLGKIAKRFGTTVDLLKKSNYLSSDLIRPGMKLKISTAHYSILVDKSQNNLILKADDRILKVYKVSTGINNSTPIGTYKIVNKLIDPVWYSAGAVVPPGSPKNILGSRWLGLSLKGYGIHGTIEPSSIGKQITAGCIRMHNKDVEELYIIVPLGTEVTIVD